MRKTNLFKPRTFTIENYMEIDIYNYIKKVRAAKMYAEQHTTSVHCMRLKFVYHEIMDDMVDSYEIQSKSV